jgi:hypothetical protein
MRKWENFKFELSIFRMAKGFRELRREERALSTVEESRAKWIRLWNLHMRYSNGYAVCVNYAENHSDKVLYHMLCQIHAEN